MQEPYGEGVAVLSRCEAQESGYEQNGFDPVRSAPPIQDEKEDQLGR